MVKPPEQKAGVYKLVSNFPLGYRNREDITNLPPGVLVKGSQNVLTNISERIQSRKGYVLDGPAASVVAPILSDFTWLTHTGSEINLRAGLLTSAGNDGVLQYRYVDSLGVVTWRDLMTNLSSVAFNFADFWDFTSEKASLLLMVNGTSNISSWSGGITTFASATANTITKEGSTTWKEDGFFSATSPRSVIIGGTSYTYTGGETTATLTGVMPDPTLGGYLPGDVIHQAVVTTANSSLTAGPGSAVTNDLIQVISGRNQVSLGSFYTRTVYVTKVNSFTDFTFTSPTRVVGEGVILTLDKPPVAFDTRENTLTIHAGADLIYQTQFQLSADLTKESFTIEPLKTTDQQASQSQAAIAHIKNDSVFITNEPTLDTLGRVQQVVLTQQTTNFSDSIKLDFDSYDFTDCATFYHRYNIYVAIPAEDLVLVYNLSTNSWETPLTMSISRFYTVEGELYGHSYLTGESYKLFEGYTDNGAPISCIAAFSFQNYGDRAGYKSMNEFYLEGYINANTLLTLNLNLGLDGCQTNQNFTLDGSDQVFVCIPTDAASLGKTSLGKNPLGGTLAVANDLPPKFRWIPTFNRVNFFENQVVLSSVGEDQQWEVLAFGGNVKMADAMPVELKQ